MKDSDADTVFEKIQKRKEITRSDLIPILLSPLMSGKMQAVLYAFANKFLNNAQLKEIEEAITMTKLGQMLMERGKAEGIKALTETCQELGLSPNDTLSKLKTKFHLEESVAKEYLLKFWK